MSATVSTTMQNTAVAAAGAAANGSKNAAYLTSISSSIGNNFVRRLYRNGTLEYSITCSGALSAYTSGNVITLPTSETVTTNLSADIDTGTWEHRIEKNGDNTVYIASTLGPTGAGKAFTLSTDLDGTTTVTFATGTLTCGGFDTVTSSIYTVENLVKSMYQANDIADSQIPRNYTNSYNRSYVNNAPSGQYSYITSPGGRYAFQNTPIRLQGPEPGSTTIAASGDSTYNAFPWIWNGGGYQPDNTATNTRVQRRNAKYYYLTLSGQWVLHSQNSVPATDANGYFYKSSRNNDLLNITTNSGAQLSHLRDESSNGGGSSLGSIGLGTANTGQTINGGDIGAGSQALAYRDYGWHWYPHSGLSGSKQYFLNNIQGVLNICEFRNILHNPVGTDDRANARQLVLMGVDWGYSGGYFSEYMHSKWHLVPASGDWILASCTDIDPAILATNPPPGFTN